MLWFYNKVNEQQNCAPTRIQFKLAVLILMKPTYNNVCV